MVVVFFQTEGSRWWNVDCRLLYGFSCKIQAANAKLFFFVSELMDLFLAGRDQPQADQPNDLAEGHPPL